MYTNVKFNLPVAEVTKSSPCAQITSDVTATTTATTNSGLTKAWRSLCARIQQVGPGLLVSMLSMTTSPPQKKENNNDLLKIVNFDIYIGIDGMRLKLSET